MWKETPKQLPTLPTTNTYLKQVIKHWDWEQVGAKYLGKNWESHPQTPKKKKKKKKNQWDGCVFG
jgi:hypothetical protein